VNLRSSKQTETFSAPNNGVRLFARWWWKVRRPDSLLYLALLLSIVAHALTYWATPHFVAAWNTPAPARFDAVLIADAPVPPVTNTPEVAASEVKPKSVKPQRKSTRTTTAARVKTPTRETPDIVAVAPLSAEEAVVATAISEVEPQQSPKPSDALPEPTKPASVAEPAVPPAAAAAAQTTSRPEPEPESTELQFPNSISIDYKMTSSVANGVANLAWKRSGASYEIDTSIQATGFFTSMFVGVFRQISRGEVVSDGVRPNFFSLQRGETGADTAEFNRASKELKIIKHGETHLSPLPERIQDMQSFLFQMAHDAAQLKPDQNTIDVQVTNARKVYQYKFRRIGEEIVQTRLGALPTIHLKSEAADPEDVYEVWLSPQHFYMPIKLKFFMGRFPIEQVANSVRITEANTSSNASGTRK
jgi:Protein of unknown function (DUF3108)